MSRRISSEKPSSPDDDEVLWGAAAIGAVINRTAGQVHHLHGNKEENKIPIDKVGHRTYRSTRRRMKDWAAGQS